MFLNVFIKGNIILASSLKLVPITKGFLTTGKNIIANHKEVFLIGSSTRSYINTSLIALGNHENPVRWKLALNDNAIRNALLFENTLIVTKYPDEHKLGIVQAYHKESGILVWERTFSEGAAYVFVMQNKLCLITNKALYSVNFQNGKDFFVLPFSVPYPTDSNIMATDFSSNNSTSILIFFDGYLQAFSIISNKFYEQWVFKSIGGIRNLYVIRDIKGIPTSIFVTGKGASYSLSPLGNIYWRLFSWDVFSNFHSVQCQSKKHYLLKDTIDGIYFIDEKHIIKNWLLTGGNFKFAGFIPTPFPLNSINSVTAIDLNNDGNDEIIATSMKYIFVYDCNGLLLDKQIINANLQLKKVEDSARAPDFEVFRLGNRIILVEENQLSSLEWK